MHGNFSPPRNRLSPHHRVRRAGRFDSRNGLVRYRAQIQPEPLTQKSSDPSLLAVKVRMGLSGRGRFAGREKPETHTRSNSGIASVDHELGASDERGFLRYKE